MAFVSPFSTVAFPPLSQAGQIARQGFPTIPVATPAAHRGARGTRPRWRTLQPLPPLALWGPLPPPLAAAMATPTLSGGVDAGSPTRPRRAVLVTGAGGFIGGALVTRLAADPAVVVHAMYRRRPPLPVAGAPKQAAAAADLDGALPFPPPEGVTIHTVDVTNSAAVAALVAAVVPSVVYHAAGVVTYHRGGRAAMEAVNVGGTVSVVDAVAAASAAYIAAATTASDADGGDSNDGGGPPPPPPRLIHLSSVAALGSLGSPADTPLTEATTAAGSGAWRPAADGAVGYLATKRAAADVVTAAAAAGRLPGGAILACPTTVYGYGDAAKSSRGTVVRAAAGRWPLYTSGGVNVVAIDAVVDALVEAADVALPAGEGAVSYILGGVNLTIHQLLTAFAAAGAAVNAGADPSAAAAAVLSSSPRSWSERVGGVPWLWLPTPLARLLGAVGDAVGSTAVTTERVAVSTRYHWYTSARATQELRLAPTDAAAAIGASVCYMDQAGMLGGGGRGKGTDESPGSPSP